MARTRYFLSVLAVSSVLGAFVFGQSSVSAAPPGFFALNSGDATFGIGGQLSTREAIWDEIQATGVTTFRMAIRWSETSLTCTSGYNFSLYDDQVRRAALHGITILAVLYSMPGECETKNQEFPVAGSPDYKTWISPNGLVYRAVKRYGYNGSFWAENPSVPYHPITNWEIWNEVNAPINNPPGGVQPQLYARFLIDTSTAIHNAQAEIAPSANPKILIGGLSTANKTWMSIPEFFAQMYNPPTTWGEYNYTVAQLHAAFDGLGLHPYALGGTAADAEAIVTEARSTLDSYGDSDKSLWITELGWPVGYFGITLAQQATYLEKSFSWLANNATQYKIENATWYFIRDTEPPPASWDAAAGLKEFTGAFRPSWCKFLALNGRSCALQVAAGTTPSIARDPKSGYIFIAYRNSQGGISYAQKAPGQGWSTYALGGNVAANTSPSMIRSESAAQVFIAYRDTNGRISYWTWSQSSGWVNGTLGGGSTGDAAAESSPAVVWDPTFTGIYYRSTSGGLNEWYWWQNQWSKLTVPSASVAAKTSPSVSRDPTSGFAFIAYRQPSGGLGYTQWSPSSGWGSGNLSANVSAETSPSAVRSESAQQVFIAYRDGNTGKISYWNWAPTSGWTQGSFASGPVATGASPSLTWDPNYAGIVFRDAYSAQAVSEWHWVWPTGWTLTTLPVVGWVTSNPAIVRDPATGNASFAFANQAGQLTNLTWQWDIPGGWMQVVP